MKTREAFVALVKKLDEINENKSFQGIWAHAFVRGYQYDGPTYEHELEAARLALEESEHYELLALFLLERARTVLSNMALENDRKWWQFWIPRWGISDEPLRGDAANLVKLIEEWREKLPDENA